MASAAKSSHGRLLWINASVATDSISTRLLARSGIYFDLAVGSFDGRRLAISRRYKAIMCDLSSIDEISLELISQIRRSRPATPIVILANRATIHATVQAMQLGVLDVIEKPVTEGRLLDVAFHLTETWLCAPN